MWNEMQVYIDNAIGIVPMVFQMLDELESTVLQHISMLMWSIWWKRNQVCWQGKLPTTYEINRRAREHLSDWIKARMMRQNRSSTSIVLERHEWTKPPMGVLKCNIDTACCSDLNIYCVAACVCDAQGQFVKAYTRRFKGKPEIAEAEASGVLEALQWLRQEQLSNVQIETDCLQVVQAIHNKSRNNTEFGVVIELCRSLLYLIPNCKVSHVRRQANRVAHDLAQATRFYVGPQIFDYCPPCIETIITNEKN
jgi:ribonuclease HI